MVGTADSVIRYVDHVPFSFVVLDEKRIVIELPNPITDNFYLGFTFQDPVFAKKLINTFNDLWGKGKEPLENEGTNDEASLYY